VKSLKKRKSDRSWARPLGHWQRSVRRCAGVLPQSHKQRELKLWRKSGVEQGQKGCLLYSDVELKKINMQMKHTPLKYNLRKQAILLSLFKTDFLWEAFLDNSNCETSCGTHEIRLV
jgi:hypothetical protein